MLLARPFMALRLLAHHAAPAGVRDRFAGRCDRCAPAEQLERLSCRSERLEGELAKGQVALSTVGQAHELVELLSESSRRAGYISPMPCRFIRIPSFEVGLLVPFTKRRTTTGRGPRVTRTAAD